MPLRDEHGKILRWYGILTDIEDRKRAEETLRESETRFRTFVDHATDAFFLIAAMTGTVVDVNREACESLGYTREELIGKNDFGLRCGLRPDCIDRVSGPRGRESS